MLAATGSGAAGDPPLVTLAVEPSAPYPDLEDTRNPLGERMWFVDFHARATSDRTCDRLKYSYRTDDLFSGRQGLAGSYSGSHGSAGPADTMDFGTIEGDAVAGGAVVFAATAFCSVDGRDYASEYVRLRLSIPAHSCEAGPLRVLRLSGHAWHGDLELTNKRLPLYLGQHVSPYGAWLGSDSRITYGAPECGGLRVSLRGKGAFGPGSYRARRGDETLIGPGMTARFTGSRRGGGIATENAVVAPAGARIATFDVESRTGPFTRVRVVRGIARVRGHTGTRTVTLRQGDVTTVRCAPRRSCAPHPPRRG